MQRGGGAKEREKVFATYFETYQISAICEKTGSYVLIPLRMQEIEKWGWRESGGGIRMGPGNFRIHPYDSTRCQFCRNTSEDYLDESRATFCPCLIEWKREGLKETEWPPPKDTNKMKKKKRKLRKKPKRKRMPSKCALHGREKIICDEYACEMCHGTGKMIKQCLCVLRASETPIWGGQLQLYFPVELRKLLYQFIQ